MIVFLYGSDGYRIKQATDRLVSQYKEKHGPDADVFSIDLGEESNTLDKATNLIKSVSFFDAKKVIVLKNAFSSGNASELAGMVKARGLVEDKSVTLIIAENAPGPELSKKNKELWQLLSKKPIQTKSIDAMTGKKLEAWVEEQAVMVGCKLDRAVITELVNIVGTDSWLLSMEIDKLAAFSLTKNKDVSVTAEDVRRLVVAKEDLNVFEFLDALSSKNKAKALVLLEDRMVSGEDTHHLISMVAYQLRNLISVKDLTEKAVPYARIAKLTNIHPFAVRKAFECSKNFELNDLKSLFSRLTKLDIDIKNGDIDGEDGLYKFILEF